MMFPDLLKIIFSPSERKTPFFIVGPCAIESETVIMEVASELRNINEQNEIQIIFKSSFDKANRTSIASFRGCGIEAGLKILGRVKSDFSLPVITDIHEAHHANISAEYVDMLQIPAFLCRQTDLLLAAGKTMLPVNIKKGQFMSPYAMRYSVDKVNSTGNRKVLITERGSFFGYGDLVVDFRNLIIMKKYAPIVFDATHSVQKPSNGAKSSSGHREFVASLSDAAAALRVDGFFFETHPDPDKALSDGPNMIPLDNVQSMIKRLCTIWKAAYE